MLFTELRFVPFFLLVFAVHWALRRDAGRKLWLLLASYAFYAAWDGRFLALILASTLIDYGVALRLQQPNVRRRLWVSVSLVANLGLLAVFKYFNFFLDSAADLLGLLGFQADLPTLRIILPVGISFYTFQTLSYTLDVYFERLRPTRNLLDVALFVAFFPQLVAGPIVRASDFLPQLRTPRRIASIAFRPALLLFLSGYIKKACISDQLAPWVDSYFQDPASFDAAAAWLATIFYAVQIYCDFSGYSDMAIACAALLGYSIPLNFDFPYFATDITDFWRRWHMSLSRWLRDYLYIPLGGNRGSLLFTYRNLALTMLLGGLWHGASWNFVLWGALHGLALIVHREWTRRVDLPPGLRSALRPFGMAATFLFVCLCWIFFRAADFERAWIVVRAFVLFDGAGEQTFQASLASIPVVLAALHACARTGLWRRGMLALPPWAFAMVLGCVLAVAQTFTSPGLKPFIYFQF